MKLRFSAILLTSTVIVTLTAYGKRAGAKFNKPTEERIKLKIGEKTKSTSKKRKLVKGDE